MRVVVYHRDYGCDTGCCGHVVQLGDKETFIFDHADTEDPLAFAKALVSDAYGVDHVADLDWDACFICDWDEQIVAKSGARVLPGG